MNHLAQQLQAAVLADANRPSEEREIWRRAVNIVLHKQGLFGDDLYAQVMNFIVKNNVQLPSEEELAAADAQRSAEKQAQMIRDMAAIEAQKAAAASEWEDSEVYEYI